MANPDIPDSISLSPASRLRFFFFFFSSSAALWDPCKHKIVYTREKEAHDRRGSSDDREDELGKALIR